MQWNETVEWGGTVEWDGTVGWDGTVEWNGTRNESYSGSVTFSNWVASNSASHIVPCCEDHYG